MATPMKTRKVIQALRRNGCTELRSAGDTRSGPARAESIRLRCPHPHNEITAGVVRSIEKQMARLSKGWLK